MSAVAGMEASCHLSDQKERVGSGFGEREQTQGTEGTQRRMKDKHSKWQQTKNGRKIMSSFPGLHYSLQHWEIMFEEGQG